MVGVRGSIPLAPTKPAILQTFEVAAATAASFRGPARLAAGWSPGRGRLFSRQTGDRKAVEPPTGPLSTLFAPGFLCVRRFPRPRRAAAGRDARQARRLGYALRDAARRRLRAMRHRAQR